nr:hypothetical protein [Tanacetum cinerariifolium]
MARLLFCDYYNMVVILEKGEHNIDFHPMVDFLEASPLSPSFSGRIVPLFDAMLVHQGEGSGTPTEPHHTPSPKAQTPSHTTHPTSSLPPITTTSIPTVTPTETTPIRHYTRRTRIAQSFVPLTVADEPASPHRDVSQGEACPTNFGFIADQDRETIVNSSTLPYDSAPRVTSPAAVEGSMQHTIPELTALFLASGVVNVPTGSGSIPTTSTPAEGSVPTGSEEVPTVSPVFATATVVTPYRRRKGKKLWAEQIARDAEIARIHAEEELQSMIDGLDSNNETVAKYLEEYRQFSSELPMERRIELISDLVKYQDNYTKVYKFQSQQRKSWTKKQKRDYYMDVIRNNIGWKVKDFKGMTFKEVEAKFNSVCKQMEDFIPMGSKEEAERIKRKGINLEQESTKKQKSSEEITKEAKSPEEVTEEKIKEMMQLVPIEEVYVEALQVKHPIIDWEVHTKGQRAYWKITRLGGSSASYQFFTDLLKHLDKDDLNQLWSLVKETLSKRPATSYKEMELWVELSRLYEPDKEDQLWIHAQNFMHAPVDWKLYDSCGVHHVAAKDKEIFMLVEKDYPLRKGLALMMICYKLQVENFSQMADDLVRKIYNIANSPRQQ